VVIVFAAVATVLLVPAWPALAHSGLGFVTGTKWDPPDAIYGALPFIVGTLLTSAIGLLFAVPIGVGAAIFLAEFAPRRIGGVLSTLVELLAAVPSVVYGLWGLFVLGPIFANVIEPHLSFLPFAKGPVLGVGLLLSGVVLAVMVLPIITAVTRDLARAVPAPTREAVYGLGGTRWQVVRRAVLPSIRAGVIGAIVLALGRALGETMAVTFVIGNTNAIPSSLLGPAQTLSSLIANEFGEATEPFHESAVLAIAVLLVVIAVLVNILARTLVWSVNRQVKETV
ncbi:MAG TPA: phosphate ABC transporter permease subunit PstC, partial [Candidatus Dormibacteraeota bacterium]|nr:phosphate ABC transporter permease subunit PstC [Candidatus Dormibacteraeota bacterium]